MSSGNDSVADAARVMRALDVGLVPPDPHAVEDVVEEISGASAVRWTPRPRRF